jgi:hypothetical protein
MIARSPGFTGELRARGNLGIQIHRGTVKAPFAWKLRNLPNLLRGLPDVVSAWFMGKVLGLPTPIGRLWLKKRDGVTGITTDYGLVSCRVVTTAWVTFLAAQLITDSSEIGDFKYHDSGTDSTAENIANTSMGIPVADNLRTVGTQVQGASAVAYRSVGTIAYTGGHAITEWGVFSNTRANAGTLLDRTVFTAVNVVNTDSITGTYEITLTAGG